MASAPEPFSARGSTPDTELFSFRSRPLPSLSPRPKLDLAALPRLASDSFSRPPMKNWSKITFTPSD